jgi:hypothetical protein
VDPKLITPLLLSLVFVWAIYRRVRRNFGRQPLHAGRLQFRLAVLAVIAVLLLLASVRTTTLIGALLAGIACGAALGYLGLRYTKFEVTPQGRFYTPHTYLGLLVSALFLGRVIFRFLTIYLAGNATPPLNQNPFQAYQKSPLTLAIFGLLAGYYVLFNLGVLRRSRELALPATDTPKP